LSNLDAKLRKQMRFELADLQRRLGMTMIYVTHNQEEALVMSTLVLLMDQGRLVQLADPRDLYRRPVSRFAADFLGEANFLDGTVVGATESQTVVLAGEGGLTIASAGRHHAPRGARVTAMMRPSRMRLSLEPPGSANAWQAVVRSAVFAGDENEVWLDATGTSIRARSRDPVDVGMRVWVSVEPDDVVVLADDRSTPPGDDAGV
jgi:ABC-type Fe3+/spermidine/putrescine transport system ATPase subunit